MAAQEALQPLRWRYGDVDDGNFAVHGRSVPLLVAIIVLLVCFVGFCLYLRWACHRYYRYASDAAALPRYYASSSSSAAAPAAAYLVTGLDDATIAGLPVTPYRPGASGAGADDAAAQCCSICLGEFAESEKVKALPRCWHGFHPECVDPWLRARASCPLCRRSLLAAAAATKRPDVAGSEAV
ncbi:hypothetical protein ACP70R_036498 [Stipagrostis hirtigluma subsp. patula]